MATLIHGAAYGGYDLGPEHPFSPHRQEMTLDLLRRLGALPPLVDPPVATREEIIGVHREAYVEAVEQASRGELEPNGREWGLGTPDTPVFPGMDGAARALVGGTLHGARLIAQGRAQRVLQLGGGLHHAHPARASGFCVYNDLAVAIRFLRDQGLYVAYVDVDVHHGDGVQAAFSDDDRVMTVSFHESGQYLFPGSGGIHELGEGMGRGLKINVPLEPFTEGASYLEAFEAVLPSALERFEPAVMVVQAGADAHFDDPLADLALTTRDYERLFRRLLALAEQYTSGRVLFTLGGGYAFSAAPRVWTILALLVQDLEVPQALPAGWVDRWADLLADQAPLALHDPDPAFEAPPRREEIMRRNRQVVSRLLDSLSPFWF